MPGSSARIWRAARRPSSVWVGGMRMSTTATSGRCVVDRREQPVEVAGQRDDVEAGRLEHAGDALAQQQRVLADHDAHGITPRTRRPAAGRAVDLERAVERGEPVGHPAQAGAGGRIGAAAAVVGDLDRQHAVGERDAHVGAGRLRVADDVGQRLGGEEVRGGLDRRRAALLGRRTRGRPAATRGGPACAARGRGRARSAPRDGCRARARAARRWPAAAPRARPRAARRFGSSPFWMHLQVQPDREQAALRAVVEVALEPAARLVGGGDDPRARLAQLALALRGGR